MEIKFMTDGSAILDRRAMAALELVLSDAPGELARDLRLVLSQAQEIKRLTVQIWDKEQNTWITEK